MMIRPLVLAAIAIAFALPLAANASSHAPSSASGATMPSCATNDPVVWVNTKSKVYHSQGDAYFGKTKAGRYACTSKAISMGAHAVGAKTSGTPSGSAVDAPDDSATTAPLGSKHKKKHATTSPSSAQ